MEGDRPANSRYAGVETAEHVAPDGRRTPYLRRRLSPPPAAFATLGQHVVTEGERIDTVAARHLGDPEMGWLIADANGAMDMAELTTRPGRRLRITLPAGLPGLGEG